MNKLQIFTITHLPRGGIRKMNRHGEDQIRRRSPAGRLQLETKSCWSWRSQTQAIRVYRSACLTLTANRGRSTVKPRNRTGRCYAPATLSTFKYTNRSAAFTHSEVRFVTILMLNGNEKTFRSKLTNRFITAHENKLYSSS